MSSKELRVSHRARQRVSQASPDVQALVASSLGLANAGSRTEGMYWEERLSQTLDRLLDGAQPGAIAAALEQLNQQDGNAYGALVESIEHAAETVKLQPSALRVAATESQPETPLHGLLVTAPVVAWTRFSIPTCAIAASAYEELTRLWQEVVLAPDVRFQMLPWLYSLDQLPHDFAELRKFTRRLSVSTANGGHVRLDIKSMPETAEMLADTRFLVGCVIISDTSHPVFRWQLSGAEYCSREDCLTQWSTRSRPLMEAMLPGCGFESILPDAYHANLRESDRMVRIWGIKAAVHYLVHSLGVDVSVIRAFVAGFGHTRVDEYRIGLSLGDSDDVVQGIVWPLLGPESENDDPAPIEQIRHTLQDVGVNDLRVWNTLMEPEFCEDCGTPLYPNRSGELVHVQMPEGAELASPHFH